MGQYLRMLQLIIILQSKPTFKFCNYEAATKEKSIQTTREF